MVSYGSIPKIQIEEGEMDDKNHPRAASGDRPLLSSSSMSLSQHYPRERRDMGMLAMLVVAMSLILYAMVSMPGQDVAVFRDGGALGAIAFGSHQDDTEDRSGGRHKLEYKVPFPTVDRADYNDPASGFIQKDLFHPSLLSTSDSDDKEANHHDFVFPYPTGAFWNNLVLHPTADRGLSYPVAVYPYAYKWSPTLLQLSYPVAHRKEEPTMIHDYFFPDLTLSTDGQDNPARYITAFDPLSVTVRFQDNDSSSVDDKDSSFWEAYLVQGSPYITLRYQQKAPKIHAMSIFRGVICPEQQDPSSNNVNDAAASSDGSDTVCRVSTDMGPSGMPQTVTGVRFLLQSQEGFWWLVVSSKTITFQVSPTSLVSTEAFDGVLRIAHVPPTHHGDGNGSPLPSLGVSRLIQHAATYPVGGNVSWSFRSGKTASAPRIATIQFEFTTKSFAPSSSSPPKLLMLALPHHATGLSTSLLLNQDDFDLVYHCIKGPLAPVIGSTWAYDEVLPGLGFDGDLGSNSMEPLSDPRVSSAIITSLKEDSILALPTTTENVYGFGKQSARLAQLCHICNAVLLRLPEGSDETEKVNLVQLRDHLISILSSSLQTFLDGNVLDNLVYDRNLGGMVSLDGLQNTEADFGNGRYNDHHFHYGYMLYACAVLGNLDPTFVEQYGHHVDAVFFDIAYDANSKSHSSDSAFFPFTRHKVWFDGHSFASGMFPFGNGKSQESSSEAVNGYYGAYLWSLVRNGHGSNPESDTSNQTDFARLLLATEIRGAKTYWHMSTENSAHKSETQATIYPPAFAENFMVGNLGMLDAICSTWFGTDPLYVHMINFIPVTSVTGDLFSKAFVSEEIAHAMRPAESVEMAWRGYVIADSAITDPNKAWDEAQNLFSPELDSGLSKSQVLYWIATRDGFDVSQLTAETSMTAVSSSDATGPGTTSSTATSSCQENAACARLGLTGSCCPTTDGIVLGCCS